MATTYADPWETLGITSTDDDRLIKRAYAAKLKELNATEGPDAFMVLRAAFEAARSQAWHMREHSLENEAQSSSTADQSKLVFDTALEQERGQFGFGDSTEVQDDKRQVDQHHYNAEVDDINAAIHRIARAVFEEAENPLDEHELEEAFDKLVKSPGMSNIDIAAQVEFQLAHMVLNAASRGLLLAQMARYHFGWQQRAMGYDAPEVIVAAEQLGEMSQFFRAFEKTEFADYRDKMRADEYAWFKQGPNGLKASQCKRVSDLIRYFEESKPEAFHFLDPELVKKWNDSGYWPGSRNEGSSGDSGGGFSFAWIWMIIVLLGALTRCDTGSTPDPKLGQIDYKVESNQEEIVEQPKERSKNPTVQEVLNEMEY